MGYVDKLLLRVFISYTSFLIVFFLKNYAKILYVKWIKGECRHFCFMCEYRNQCFDNLEW